MLKTPLKDILRTNSHYIQLLAANGLNTVADLVMYFPRAYEDRSTFRTLAEVNIKETNNIRGKLYDIDRVTTKNGHKLVKARFIDEKGGEAEVVWFNQTHLASTLKEHTPLVISGKPKFEYGRLSFLSPKYEYPNRDGHFTIFGRIIPIYPEIDKLSSDWFFKKVAEVRKDIFSIKEVLPWEVLNRKQLMPRKDAILELHFPTTSERLEAARRRMSFEEMYSLQYKSLARKIAYQQQAEQQSPAVPLDVEIVKEILTALPFTLTDQQKIATFQILKDMEKTVPMQRLLEGDVGSGKTVVATIAAIHAIKKAGVQVAIMAPTEILATQHFRTIAPLAASWGINVQFLAGSLSKKEKEDIALAAASGRVDLLIGTHALIQDQVAFHKLGLVVIDEQHRFGVEQRRTLISHGFPHVLHMTATPIPRTLALTIYGDQDLTIISELPKGRKPIVTRIVQPHDRQKMYTFMEDKIEKGRQVFVICPLIEESEKLEEVRAATKEYEFLSKHIFPKRRVTLLHGKMKASEKDTIMKDFKDHKYDVLVSTSVIEVGIDVPNASIIMIEGAERFGLSQLHQFRGRVGRGEHQSYCFLATDKAYAEHAQRLRAMEKHADGFHLAEIDLELRGPGEVYGVKQSGIPNLRMASYMDLDLIMEAREEAEKVLEGKTVSSQSGEFLERIA